MNLFWKVGNYIHQICRFNKTLCQQVSVHKYGEREIKLINKNLGELKKKSKDRELLQTDQCVTISYFFT